MRNIAFIFIFLIAIFSSNVKISTASTNAELEAIFAFRTTINHMFNQEFYFDEYDAQALFLEELNNRGEKLIKLESKKSKRIKRSRKRLNETGCLDLVSIYRVLWRGARILLSLGSVWRANRFLQGEKKRQNNEEYCLVHGPMEMWKYCSILFKNSYFRRNNWNLNPTREASCQYKKVGIYKNSSTQSGEEYHTHDRWVLQCPVIGPDENNLFGNCNLMDKQVTDVFINRDYRLECLYTPPNVYYELKEFNVYFSATDSKSDDHQKFYLFTDDDSISNSASNSPKVSTPNNPKSSTSPNSKNGVFSILVTPLNYVVDKIKENGNKDEAKNIAIKALLMNKKYERAKLPKAFKPKK